MLAASFASAQEADAPSQGIEAELAWLAQAAGAPAWGEALQDPALSSFLKSTGSYMAQGPVDLRRKGLGRAAVVGLSSLPAVLSPLPAFAAQPLPPNLAITMAARPAAPPGLAAAGSQVLPLAPSMRHLNHQVSPRPAAVSSPMAQPAAGGNLPLSPRLKALLASPKPVAIASGQHATRLYQVAKGDTLYSIAADLLGSGARWRELHELNRNKVGSGYLLRVGQSLRVPSGPPTVAQRERPQVLAARVPANSPPHPNMRTHYQVARGDSLYLIAAKRLGNPNRWREIVAANPGVLKSGSLIYPNQWLAMPRNT